jgi:hypothetical protein
MNSATSLRHPSNSSEQRLAETLLLRKLSRVLGCALAPRRFVLRSGVTVDVDGGDEVARVLCEAYAHIGATRGSQPAKIARDALKLWATAKSLGGKWRKVLCFSDEVAARCATGRSSWLSAAIRELGVEVHVCTLPKVARRGVLRAQNRQRMVNRS